MIDNDRVRIWLKSTLLLVPVALVCLPVIWVLRFMDQRARPGIMTIHCPPAVCRSISVSKEDAPIINRASASDRGTEVTPISHGLYAVNVTFADNSQARVSYFHSDAGDRKRVDLYIERLPKDQIKVRATGYLNNSPIDEAVGDRKSSTAEKPIHVGGP